MKNNLLIILTVFFFIATSCSNSTESEVDEFTEEEQESLTDEEIEKYKEIGLEYALSTKQTLGKNLIKALSEGGPEQALSYCNVNAMPLTDSMSQSYNAVIKRATDQTRNPNNKANAQELEEIAYYKNLVVEGKTGTEIQPRVRIEGDKVHFYYPILTNDMCLQCHGVQNETLSPETLASISKLYPEDQATGYQNNEVRGIWSIIFDR